MLHKANLQMRSTSCNIQDFSGVKGDGLNQNALCHSDQFDWQVGEGELVTYKSIMNCPFISMHPIHLHNCKQEV